MNITGHLEILEDIRYNDDEKLLNRFFELESCVNKKEAGLKQVWETCDPLKMTQLQRTQVGVIQLENYRDAMEAAAIINELQRRYKIGRFW